MKSFCTAQQAAQSGQSVWDNSRKAVKKAVQAAAKAEKKPSIKGLIKKAKLPHKGKLRYIPPKKFDAANGLPWGSRNGYEGYEDRFGNIWVKGKSRTLGVRCFKEEWKEWDVQLSPQGVQQVGWMTRDNTHLNVSLEGRVTHK